MIINEALQTLLNKLLINNIHDFPYIELINMYKPIIKRGEFVISKKENRRRLKEGKSAYDKDNWEYFQTTIDYYKFYPSYEYKINAQNRLKEVGIFR